MHITYCKTIQQNSASKTINMLVSSSSAVRTRQLEIELYSQAASSMQMDEFRWPISSSTEQSSFLHKLIFAYNTSTHTNEFIDLTTTPPLIIIPFHLFLFIYSGCCEVVNSYIYFYLYVPTI